MRKRWLESLGNSGREISEETHGRYAVTSRGNARWLPFLSEQDAVQRIGEIEKKFPIMAEHGRRASACASHFVSPGISGSQ